MSGSSLTAILCNYNHGRYVREALDALASQSRPADQFLVLDDGSTDDSVAVIEAAARRYPMIQLVRNDRNRGLMFTIQRALEMATGDYYYWAASDDRVLPGFFEKSMRLLEQHPQAALCCAYPSYLEDETGRLWDYVPDWGDTPGYFPPDRMTDLLRKGPITGQSCILNRRILHEAGGYRPDLRWQSDWFIYQVMAFRHGICYVPERLAVMRCHSQSYSAAGMRRWADQRLVLHRILDLLHSPEYRDLLPIFIASGVLPQTLGWGIVRAVMCSPRYWRPGNFRLVFQWQLQRRLRRCIPFAGRKRPA